jgi:hypothetical protein
MFACLVSGRLVQTNYHQVADDKIVFSLDNATAIHHVVLFLTGSQPLPDGLGAVIYFGWPPYEHWQTMGWISNDKPSAIFKVHQVLLAPWLS